MGIIKPASYPDRGFARIGNIASFCIDATKTYCTGRLRNVYELENSGNEIWLRSKERRTGNYFDYAEEIALVDINTNRDAKWILKVESDYDIPSDQMADTMKSYDLIKSASNKPLKDQIYLYSLALLLVKSTDRALFLEKFFFPWFFGLFPSGLILALKFNYDYETRAAMLRWGNIGTVYDSKEKNDMQGMGFEGVGTMTALHNIGMVNAAAHFSALSNIFFPYATTYIIGRFGYMLILLTNEKQILERGHYPHSLVELHHVYGLMQGNEPDLLKPRSIEEGWLGRYIPSRSFSARELLDLFRHFILKFNHSLRLRLDVTNYRKGKDIDFIAAFERFSTFERITMELNRCQTAEDGFSARILSFAMLDKFAELIRVPGIDPGKTFHHFVTRQFKDKSLLPRFKNLPPPFDGFFHQECNQIFDSLYYTVLGKKGLWMTYRKTAKGIRTREWDKYLSLFQDAASLCSEEEFVGEIVRAIRNTHHGYVSNKDKKRRFSIFGSMHTGKLPDQFTAIPQLIWLTTFEDPRIRS